ncbi:hypothetical protein Cgig2_027269 [Carnegiea gigantea]|uniref:Aminotransferase-like plant mobile domain-containing protein n=1 Tax=Carnegiea gigantea TaxID=171969 RepID=A0A9Q1GRU4_9CARY|nr:hypothetical protein Cgig2_027269 [Carnegiea gigantea]
MTILNATAKGEPAAFLSFWLSYFVLPHGKEVIRLEKFVMATLMTSGQQISLAPTMLAYIYHGLGDAASRSDYLGKAIIIFLSHYVIGWLIELFPSLYHSCPNSDCLGNFPSLVLSCLVANLQYPRVNVFSVIVDSFFLSLAHIQRSVMDRIQAYADHQIHVIGLRFYAIAIPRRNLQYHHLKKNKELMDVNQINALSNQDLTYSFEIVHIKDQLNNMSSKASKPILKEKEILEEEEQVCKMQEDSAIQ